MLLTFLGLHLRVSHFPEISIWICFFTNFCPIKTDLSGSTVWMQASGFQKLAKMNHFWLTFVHSKCKRSSLRSQCWMRLYSAIFKHCVLDHFFQLASNPCLTEMRILSQNGKIVKNWKNWTKLKTWTKLKRLEIMKEEEQNR